MWGQVNGGENKNDVEGIIPTRVGTRRSDIAAAIYGVGSSPRVWGQASFGNKIFYAFRIIPTRVGTSVYPICKHIFDRDHPHACGDKLMLSTVLPNQVGSSPRVWGQGAVSVCHKLAPGIIPTRVGTRCCQCLSQACPRDHPHACGDKGVFC